MTQKNSKLKQLRIALLGCATAREFSELTGIPYQTIKEMESGRNYNPTLDTMKKIHRAVKEKTGADLNIMEYFQ